jgi:hypothetical protein
LREHNVTGINIESEHGIVLKHDEDCAGVVVNFNQFHDLPFDFGKAVVT